MAYDCRLLSDFYNHPKTRRLMREFGAEGVVALQKIWLYATEYEPTGVFAGSSRELLADAAGLAEGEEAFIDRLVIIGFLECGEDGTYAIHNWAQRNPYCARRDEIKAQKSSAGKASAHKKRETREKKEARKAKRKQAVANESTPVQQALQQPFQPHPIPSHPKSERDTLSHSLARGREGERARELFFALVQEAMPEAGLRNPAAWTRELQKLLDAGWTVEGLLTVMRWALQDGFWSTRILSPKAFADNCAKVAMQMRQETTAQVPCIGETIASGCSEEEWEQKRKARKGEGKKGEDVPP